MYPPGTFVEITVVGLTCLIVTIPILAAFIPGVTFDNLSQFMSLGSLLPALVSAYIFGIFFDGIADNLLASRRRPIRKLAIEKHNKKVKVSSSEISSDFDFHQAVMLIFNTSEALKDQLMYLRHKVRIARSMVFLFPLLMFGVEAILVTGVNVPSLSLNQRIVYMLIMLVVLVAGTTLIYRMWFGFELAFYRHAIDGFVICMKSSLADEASSRQ